MKCNRVRITLYDKLSSLRSIKCKSQQIKLSDINANHFFRLEIGSIPPLWLFSNFHAYDKNSGGIEGMRYIYTLKRLINLQLYHINPKKISINNYR